MKLQVPFIQLPLLYDAGALAAEVAALGESVWRPHPQGFAGNSMLPLLATEGDPANESFAGRMLPTPELKRCPYLMQTLASFGAILGRTRLMRLAGQAEVTQHTDQGYYWAERVRVHVPIVTQPTVRFECGGAAINMAAGECWIFDTWRLHRVLNDAAQSRIHLVADTVGGGEFWELVARGRPHDGPGRGTWAPRTILPGETSGELACETANVPVVMTPWEIEHHLRILFADLVPNPHAQNAQHAATRFLQRWRGLWARYGDSGAGKPEYRAALQGFLDDLSDGAVQMKLRNGTNWFHGMMGWVGKFAVGADHAAGGGDEYT